MIDTEYREQEPTETQSPSIPVEVEVEVKPEKVTHKAPTDSNVEARMYDLRNTFCRDPGMYAVAKAAADDLALLRAERKHLLMQIEALKYVIGKSTAALKSMLPPAIHIGPVNVVLNCEHANPCTLGQQEVCADCGTLLRFVEAVK